MQRYAELEAELGREEDCYFDEEITCDLQCGDSLAIAANRMGEDAFGIERLLRRLRVLRRGHHSATSVPPVPTSR